ncbi:hypothetical protein Tco_0934079 [Tanacetum coccineum]
MLGKWEKVWEDIPTLYLVHLTNQAILESAGEKIPKPKYVKNKDNPESSPKKKSAQASEGKRLKTSAKVTKPTKNKQPATTSKAKGLNVLSEVALSKAEQMKLATKRSKTQFHSSHASGSDDQNDDDADNEDDDDQNEDNADNEGDDDQDDDNEQTESDNDDDNFIHPKLSTFDKKGEELDEEETNEEDEVNELYRDMYVNLEGRDTEMTDDPQTNVQGTQVTKDTYVIIAAATPEVP